MSSSSLLGTTTSTTAPGDLVTGSWVLVISGSLTARELEALLRSTLADLAAVDVSRVTVFLAEEIEATIRARRLEEDEEQLFADYIISVPIGLSAASMAEDLSSTDAEAAVRARLVNSTNITVQLAVQQVATAVIASVPEQTAEEDAKPETPKGLVVGVSTSGALLLICLAGSLCRRRPAKHPAEEPCKSFQAAVVDPLPDLPRLLSRGLSLVTMEEGRHETKGAEGDEDEVIISRL